jgi:hypothetical protein
MHTLRLASLAIALLTSATAVAQQFDGSVPLECMVQSGYDCLPGKDSCGPLKPETKITPVYAIDFANKQVRSPFRTKLLTVAHTTTNTESLVLQGADLLFAWSALIHKKTGILKVAIADREGAYVVFGQCKPAAKAAE